MKHKKFGIYVLVASIVLILGNAAFVYAPGTQNTASTWGIEATNINGTTFYLDDVSLNARLGGNYVGYAFVADSLNTGQGVYELYAMDQDVETTDSVTFDTVDASEFFLSSVNKTDIFKYPQQQASYLVWVDNSTGTPYYFGKNGTTGIIDYSGSDASTVIQATIDHLTTSGGMVLLSEGRFNITSTITIGKNMDNIVFKGSGPSTVLDRSASMTTGHVILVDDSNYITIADLLIDGNDVGADNADQKGIFVIGEADISVYHHFLIENVIVHNAYAEGICLDYISNGYVINCVSYSNFWAGITFAATNSCRAINNEVYDNGRAAPAGDLGAGINVQYSSECIIKNNYIYDNNAEGIYVSRPGSDYSSRRIIISDNVLENNELVVISQANIIYDCQVRNNHIFGTGNGMRTAKTNGLIIADNIIDVSTYGIDIDDGEDIDVHNNQIKAPGTASQGVISIHLNAVINNLRITENTIIATTHRCVYLNTAVLSNVHIAGNHLEQDATVSAEIPLYILNANDLSITNNRIISSSTAISFSADKVDRLVNILITDNIISTPAAGITFTSTDGGATKTADHVKIADNKITLGTYGILVTNDAVNGFSIHDNEFRDAANWAIQLSSGVTDCSIINNRLINCTNYIRDDSHKGLRYIQQIDLFMDVLAVSTTHIRSNEDLSAGVPITFTVDAQPDVSRTLSGHFDSHAQITAYTIDIVGIDGKGNTFTESMTEADGWDWETNNAFATITSITMSARTGTGAGDTMDIGITDVLGLSNVIYETGEVYKIKKNNANEVVAGAQVSITYDTYDMAVIGLAVTDDFTIWVRTNCNIIIP